MRSAFEDFEAERERDAPKKRKEDGCCTWSVLAVGG
jgi:hypothetical protein